MMSDKGMTGKRRLQEVVTILAVLFATLTCPFFPAVAVIDPEYLNRFEQVKERLVAEGFSEEELRTIFADSRVELYPQILERRAKGLNYMSRKFGLLTKKSVRKGVEVLNTHKALLGRVEASYGVDKEVIVAILRVETNFGSYTGNYPILNSLLTRAVIENRRSQWAEEELACLLRIAREQGKDPLSLTGSWAGAFGIAQFVPSSYLRYGVDGNGDGRVNLFEFADAVASIANYLKVHGWEKGRKEQNRQAVYAYNHCDSYVDAVFAYAQAARRKAGRG
jgi:membrane-bound lytic murein transglycosylase B